MAEKWQSSFSHPKEWLKGSVIGSGSFGTVHLAIDSATGSLFVAKTARSTAGIHSLKNEADILENLNSPHIVKCIGKDVSFAKNGETRYNLFFEYMAGGSLSDVAQKFGGPLDEKVIRLYTRDILQGLKYLHENGIVHSDVKCKNVLLGASGAVKLADFGCAKRLNDSKKVNVDNKNSSNSCNYRIGGTPLWMAPEVLRNEGLDFAADIWSLGCTGRPPWGGDGSNPTAQMLNIAKGNDVPDFPMHFSSDGLDFLSKCLNRDPRKRWTSEELLGHPFVATWKLECMSSRSEDAFSPTSVLDVVASYDSDYNDGDLCDDDEFVSRILFSENLIGKNGLKEFLEGSDDWITVRSR